MSDTGHSVCRYSAHSEHLDIVGIGLKALAFVARPPLGQVADEEQGHTRACGLDLRCDVPRSDSDGLLHRVEFESSARHRSRCAASLFLLLLPASPLHRRIVLRHRALDRVCFGFQQLSKMHDVLAPDECFHRLIHDSHSHAKKDGRSRDRWSTLR